MDRQHITRKVLKRNFLKEIIMRLDFQGVLQAEMEAVLHEAKTFLKQNGFDRYTENVNNQIVNNGNIIQQVKDKDYLFSSENLGYNVSLSTTCVVLSVKTQGYSSFDDYSKIFQGIIDIYRKKIDFFTCKRFGLRKINFCFVNELSAVNKYFSETYYNCHTTNASFEMLNIERKDSLAYENENLNLKYAVEQGMLGTDKVYKVTLDTDIYLLEQAEIEKILSNQRCLSEINELVFGIYIDSLTDKMIELLCDEEAEMDGIVGIEDNE